MDWNLCVLCQETTHEKLRSPTDSKQEVSNTWYDSLCCSIHEFIKENAFPFELREIYKLENAELANLFRQNQAKWHKLCRNKLSNLKLERAMKRKEREDDDIEDSQKRKARRKSKDANEVDTCFFCGQTGELHRASTLKIDSNVRESAATLQDTVLLGKLSAGDMVALDAMYHLQCLSKLYNDAARVQAQTSSLQDNKEMISKGIALAELVSYIEQTRRESNGSSVFKLSDLSKMYSSRLEQMGIDITGRINTTRLKERLLKHCPDLTAYKDGREIIIAFHEDIASVLKQAVEKNCDKEAVIISQAANIVRRDLLDMDKCQFSGTFAAGCQEASVPQSLTSLVKMIMGGASIDMQSINIVEEQAALTISQLIRFNSIVRRRKDSQASYHSKDRETPLTVYIGLLLHGETRKRGLIDKMCDLGLSISYNRILEISTEMGNNVVAQFEAEELVCPRSLKLDLFTTSAVDNIDHNPSSNTATGSLHGTAISVFQHPTKENAGRDRERHQIQIVTEHPKTSINPLPKSYADVPPVQQWRSEPSFQTDTSITTNAFTDLSLNQQEEQQWLEHVKAVIGMYPDDIEEVSVSWAAYHASRIIPPSDSIPNDTSCLLPLFPDEAKSVAMILHTMNTVKSLTDFLNPGQVPVVSCDQPLYAIAKKIQWQWPERYGERKFVTVLGGLHIEIAAWRAVGDLLEGSGWTSAITESNVASAGTADSFLKSSHVSRTRHAHQVTAATLHLLMRRAYDSYLEEQSQNNNKKLSFEEWKVNRSTSSPQFKYWSLVLKFEMTVLSFVRSLREGNFSLYKESIRALLPWFFAMDKINYARWLTVHLHDMLQLDETCKDVKQKFDDGCFVVRKSQRKFSALAIDHAHEQNNKLVKGDGGAIGLTENSSQLLRWMVSGPEVAGAIAQFESVQDLVKCKQSKGPDIHHHEQSKSTQNKFCTQVNSLLEVMETFGNPFEEGSADLMVLDSKEIASDDVVATIRSIETEGEKQMKSFVTDRLVKKTKEVTDVINLNKFPLFGSPQRSPSQDKKVIASLKQNCSLFSRLYISCQVRDGNLDEFFSHENQPFPPSISKHGELRPCNKSELLKSLETLHTSPLSNTPNVDALLIDGAALVNMLKPNGACKTFSDYAEQVYLPYIRERLHKVARVDVVWDRYIQNSLKAHTRDKRGTGIRRKVEPNGRLPGNWAKFLKVDYNKTELFVYLAGLTSNINCEDNKRVVSTLDTTAISSNGTLSDTLSRCTHEEADTRLLLHASECGKNGMRKLMIRTVDTDVVVLAIVYFSQMSISELWIAFGNGKQFRYIPVHEIVNTLGEDKSKVLHVFHAFTGCDQTSAFQGRGKNTAWATWMSSDESVTEAFTQISQRPTIQDVMSAAPVLERFVVRMYDRTSQCQNVNEARKVLFAQKDRSLENIPPTNDALLQHTKRAAYQAGHCWGQCLVSCPELPSPAEWGWSMADSGSWQPVWCTLPEASLICKELVKCGCKPDKGCSGRCKCLKAGMMCTALCKCGGECERDS